MTHSLRTVAEIEASIAFVKDAIAKSDSYMDRIESALGDEIALDWFVVGFDNGFFVNASGNLGGALWAHLYPSRALAERKLVRNGAGDWAKVMTYGQALRRQLELQADAHDDFRIMLYDLGGELADAQADAEWLEMEAAKEAYEREHRRHGSWSLRRAAAIIATSTHDYEG
jgi:hypothetical protein